jgi:YD repeat-containing protein
MFGTANQNITNLLSLTRTKYWRSSLFGSALSSAILIASAVGFSLHSSPSYAQGDPAFTLARCTSGFPPAYCVTGPDAVKKSGTWSNQPLSVTRTGLPILAGVSSSGSTIAEAFAAYLVKLNQVAAESQYKDILFVPDTGSPPCGSDINFYRLVVDAGGLEVLSAEDAFSGPRFYFSSPSSSPSITPPFIWTGCFGSTVRKIDGRPAGLSWGVIFGMQVSCPAGWSIGSARPFPGAYVDPGVCYQNISPKNSEVCRPGTPAAPPTAGNPINIFTGNKQQTELDYAIQDGLPSNLELKRFYNSHQGSFGSRISVGQNWRLSYDNRILVDDTRGLAYASRSTGAVFKFTLASGRYIADADVTATLNKSADGASWQLRLCDDSTETYDLNGNLVYAQSRQGDWNQFAYDQLGRLVTVSDQFGRTLVFAYSSDGLLSSVTLPDTSVVQYQYGTNSVLSRVLLADGRSKQYLYNEAQNFLDEPNAPRMLLTRNYLLTGIVDENANRFASFFYFKNSSRAAQSEHAGGVGRVRLNFDLDSARSGYNKISRSTEVTDAVGTTRTIGAIESLGVARASAVTQFCDGCAASSTVDQNNNVARRTDFLGNVSCYAYDLARNLETSRVEGLKAPAVCATALTAGLLTSPARKITTTWHPTFRLPATITEPLGIGGAGGSKVTTHTYDNNGKVIQRQVVTPAGTRTWNWTYDAYGRVLTATDPLGRTSTNVYYPNTPAQNATLANSRGMLASTTNALGHTVNIAAYNAHGQPLTMVDANGLTTTLAYDSRQRLTSRTVGGETTTYTYDGVGQLVNVTLPDASVLNYTYDPAHRLTQIQDGLGNKMTYVLDNMGNRVQENAVDTNGALARTKSRVYDALNRLQKDIGGATPATQITQYAYDSNGNPLSTTDPLSRTTTNSYDALNRLIQFNDPLNGAAAPTKYEYDAQDNLTKVTDPKNLATTYTYNGFNELVTQVSPDTGSTSFTYDAAGNMLTKTDARGVTVTYSYDVLNRVTSINYPATTGSTGNSAAQTVSYVYDSCGNGKGRLCSFTDRTGTTTFAYDPQGRVLSKAQNVNGLTQTIAYRYNTAGQMDEMTMPSGKRVAVNYVNNRVTGLTVDGQPVVKTAEYEPFGPIGEWTWGNDTTTNPNKHTRYFDLDGRNTKIESGNVIDPAIIVYDAASRITALQRLTSNTVDPTKSASFGYDNLDRLTTVTPGAGNAASAQSYAYDPIGNRLTNNVNGSLTNYSYGTTSHRLNALTGASAKTFGYDAAGNRLTDGIQNWIYGGDGRPSAISLAGANPTNIQSGINALGQRVLKTVNSGSSGNTTRFVYDEAGRLIGEYDINGKPIQETIWLNDLPVAVLK